MRMCLEFTVYFTVVANLMEVITESFEIEIVVSGDSSHTDRGNLCRCVLASATYG